MDRVLLVTRNFAPTSHVSVERATKLAKYLPEFGWRPTVLTGARATAGLPEDPAQLEQVAGVNILRARAPEFSLFYRRTGNGRNSGPAVRSAPKRGPWHPKAWLVPDSQVMWYPFAVRAALRVAATERWDAVIGMSHPPTAILIAHTIAARLGIPYVADFRDAWTRYAGAPRRPPSLAAVELRLERQMLADAAAVVTVATHMVAHVLANVPESDPPPVHVIPNGYDEDDFQAAVPRDLPRFSVVHTGQIRRPPGPLWDGLGRALRDRPELRGHVHFWQIGFVDAAAAGELAAPPEGVTVHLVPPVPQRESIGFMLGADLLLVEEFGPVMPSKTMQYLRAGRPILALLERGEELRDTLRLAPQAYVVPRDDPARIADVVARLAAAPRAPPTAPTEAVAAFSRRAIARRFAEVLEAACARRAALSTRDGERRAPPVPADVPSAAGVASRASAGQGVRP
jgi:glycosyltransferase involved in cell wall biosynthesis